MVIGKVVGNVWATRKDEKLNGLKFLVVSLSRSTGKEEVSAFVAVDNVGAGIGDNVLVTKGSASKASFNIKDLPIDAVIIGIIDSLEVDEDIIK